MNNIHDIVASKRAELVAAAPRTTDALAALLRDVVATWESVLVLEKHEPCPWFKGDAKANERGFKFARTRILEAMPSAFAEYWCGDLYPGAGFQGETKPFTDWLAKRDSKIAPEAVRRLIAVAGELRPLIQPAAKGDGLGSDVETCWRLIWLDALGVSAPDLGKILRPTNPVKRLRIWRLREKILEQLAATIEASHLAATPQHFAEAA
jgi:hypothetical protein